MMRIELCKSHFCFATCSLFASDHRPYREGPDRLKKVEELVSSCLRPPPHRGPLLCSPWTCCLPLPSRGLPVGPRPVDFLPHPMDLLSAPHCGLPVCPTSVDFLPAPPHGPLLCSPWTCCLPPLPWTSCLAPWTSCLPPLWTSYLSPVDFLPAPCGSRPILPRSVDFLPAPCGPPTCPTGTSCLLPDLSACFTGQYRPVPVSGFLEEPATCPSEPSTSWPAPTPEFEPC